MSTASDTVDAIIRDLSGRGGLDHVWDGIDVGTRTAIRRRWAGIVEKGMADDAVAQANAAERGELLRRMEVISRVLETIVSDTERVVAFDYVNHKGEAARRTVRLPRLRVQPEGSLFYSGQWVLHAWCIDRAEARDFLVERIENLAVEA